MRNMVSSLTSHKARGSRHKTSKYTESERERVDPYLALNKYLKYFTTSVLRSVLQNYNNADENKQTETLFTININVGSSNSTNKLKEVKF